MSPGYLLTICIGGGIGSILRYSLSHKLLMSYGGATLPWATLAVNVIGSLCIGWLYGYANLSQIEWVRPLVIIGFLGGFTTFSTFSLETIMLIESGRYLSAALYVLTTNIVAIAATGWALSMHK